MCRDSRRATRFGPRGTRRTPRSRSRWVTSAAAGRAPRRCSSTSPRRAASSSSASVSASAASYGQPSSAPEPRRLLRIAGERRRIGPGSPVHRPRGGLRAGASGRARRPRARHARGRRARSAASVSRRLRPAGPSSQASSARAPSTEASAEAQARAARRARWRAPAARSRRAIALPRTASATTTSAQTSGTIDGPGSCRTIVRGVRRLAPAGAIERGARAGRRAGSARRSRGRTRRSSASSPRRSGRRRRRRGDASPPGEAEPGTSRPRARSPPRNACCERLARAVRRLAAPPCSA